MVVTKEQAEEFSITLRGLMSRHKITQQEIADLIGFNRESVHRWLKDPVHYNKKLAMVDYAIKTILVVREENKNNEVN